MGTRWDILLTLPGLGFLVQSGHGEAEQRAMLHSGADPLLILIGPTLRTVSVIEEWARTAHLGTAHLESRSPCSEVPSLHLNSQSYFIDQDDYHDFVGKAIVIYSPHGRYLLARTQGPWGPTGLIRISSGQGFAIFGHHQTFPLPDDSTVILSMEE